MAARRREPGRTARERLADQRQQQEKGGRQKRKRISHSLAHTQTDTSTYTHRHGSSWGPHQQSTARKTRAKWERQVAIQFLGPNNPQPLSHSRLVLCARRVSQRLLTVATDPRHEFACNLRPTMCERERECLQGSLLSLSLLMPPFPVWQVSRK